MTHFGRIVDIVLGYFMFGFEVSDFVDVSNIKYAEGYLYQ